MALLIDARGGGGRGFMGLRPGLPALVLVLLSTPIPANRDMKWGSGSEKQKKTSYKLI